MKKPLNPSCPKCGSNRIWVCKSTGFQEFACGTRILTILGSPSTMITTPCRIIAQKNERIEALTMALSRMGAKLDTRAQANWKEANNGR